MEKPITFNCKNVIAYVQRGTEYFPFLLIKHFSLLEENEHGKYIQL